MIRNRTNNILRALLGLTTLKKLETQKLKQD